MMVAEIMLFIYGNEAFHGIVATVGAGVLGGEE